MIGQQNIDQEKIAQLKSLLDLGIHDVEWLAKMMHSMKENRELLERYATDGTLSTVCSDVAYYVEKIKDLGIWLTASQETKDNDKT